MGGWTRAARGFGGGGSRRARGDIPEDLAHPGNAHCALVSISIHLGAHDLIFSSPQVSNLLMALLRDKELPAGLKDTISSALVRAARLCFSNASLTLGFC